MIYWRAVGSIQGQISCGNGMSGLQNPVRDIWFIGDKELQEVKNTSGYCKVLAQHNSCVKNATK